MGGLGPPVDPTGARAHLDHSWNVLGHGSWVHLNKDLERRLADIAVVVVDASHDRRNARRQAVRAKLGQHRHGRLPHIPLGVLQPSCNVLDEACEFVRLHAS